METMKLKDPNILPTPEVLEEALGSSYPVFEELMRTITASEFGISGEWNYYNDGKAWLLKNVLKKKTVFWLSVWDGYFKIAFYFTEKNCSGLFDLGLAQSILDDFESQKPIGKLLPMTFEMREKEQLPDLLKIIGYKKNLK